jgi:hypothetical protein
MHLSRRRNVPLWAVEWMNALVLRLVPGESLGLLTSDLSVEQAFSVRL